MQYIKTNLEVEINNLINKIPENTDKYFSLLATMAKFHKYSLSEQTSLHLYAPVNASACATAVQWEKFFGRHIKRDASGIELLENAGQGTIRVVYDIKDTYTDNVKAVKPQIWQYNENEHGWIFNDLIDGNAAIPEKVIYLCQKITGEKAKELKLSSNPIAASSAYVVLKRLGYDPKKYIKKIKLTDPNMIWTVLENTNDIAKQILNPIGSYINERRNSNGKTNGNTIFRNLVKYKGTLSESRKAENISGNAEEQSTDPIPEKTGQGVRQQVLDFSRQNNEKGKHTGKSDTGISTDEMGGRSEQHQEQSQGNTDSGALSIKSPAKRSKKKEAFAKNLDAITILKILEAENRAASPDEQKILKGYIGFGGLSEAFEAGREDWQEEYNSLKVLLTDDEYRSARASVLNAHYTSETIIKNIYQGLENLGFQGGNVLEPSCGVGSFFAHLPDTINNNSQLYGVELDSLTGRIAQKIYPDANISVQGFETTSFQNDAFDLAIGNVPFGDYQVNDTEYKNEKFLIHDYFLAKMIDKTRSGGLVAVVTTKGTLDKKDEKVRKYLAKRAELVQAVRLPNNAFKAAGTEVTTDILIFKKRDRILEETDQLPDWVHSEPWDDEININSYFKNHPENVMGTIEKTSTQYGFDITCKPLTNLTLDEQLQKSFSTLSRNYQESTDNKDITVDTDELSAAVRPFGYFYKDGDLCYQKDSANVDKINGLSNAQHEKMQACIRLRESVHKVIDLQLENSTDESIKDAQSNLNFIYDDYVAKYGYVTKDKELKKLFERDASYPLLRSLEVPKNDSIEKGDIFSKRTITPYIKPDHADTAVDALIVSIQEKGKVDTEYMEELTGVAAKTLVRELEFKSIYLDVDDNEYKPAEEFLSGDIRGKLERLSLLSATIEKQREQRLTDIVLGTTLEQELSGVYQPKNPIEENILAMQYYTQPGWSMAEYLSNSQDKELITNVLGKLYRIPDCIDKKFLDDPLVFLDIIKTGKTLPGGRSKGRDLLNTACQQMGVSTTISELTADNRVAYKFLSEKFTDYNNGNTSALNNLKDEWTTYNDNISQQKNDVINQGTDETIRNLNDKLEAIQKNIAALEAVKPADLKSSDIQIELGATWIPTKDIEDFLFDTLEPANYVKNSITVNYAKATGVWNIEGKSADTGNAKASVKFGTDEINAYKLVEQVLNLREAKVYKTVYVDGEERRVIDKQATMLAQQKQEMLRLEFGNWIWKDPERRTRLTNYYNRHFNNIRPREYNGDHLTFPGMNPEINLRKHQKDAIAHTLFGKNTLLAHCVGAGKTYEMVASIMEAKRLNLCKKAMVVVPKHLTEQFGAEFLQLYPAANILIATQKDFEKENRKEFCSKIATREWDAIIMGYTQFEKIPISKERQVSLLQDEIDNIINGIDAIKEQKGERFTIKQMEAQRKKLELKLEKLQKTDVDQTLIFEELGVDRLYVDEAHYFKNLFTMTKMQNVAGVSTTDAQKTMDLFQKCRYINENNNGKGIVFATGTPISNSMTELFTMQRYLQQDRLEEADMAFFDTWASIFGKTVTAIELSPEGKGFRSKTRFAKFHNLPELMSMFKEIADIKTADMLNLPVPEVENNIERISPTEEQKSMVNALADRAEAVRNRQVQPEDDNMLLITNDGRKLALDQRLINPDLPDDPKSKVNKCINNVFDIWTETAADKSAQMIFCDLSTPGKDFNVYDDIKEKLIAKGVPKSEIAFIHDAKNEKKKDELFAKVRSGEVRVLLGSTAKMGTGTNVQDKLIALHDLDVPWRPSDLEQRRGRIVRQGNENKNVKIYRYVTEETFDAYLWQIIENKQRFIAQIMTSKAPVRSAEDIDEATLSYAEIKAIATGNPLIKEKMDLDIQLEKLKMAKSAYLQQQHDLEHRINEVFPKNIAKYKEEISALKEDIQYIKEHTVSNEDGKTAFSIDINGISYDERVLAGKALAEIISNHQYNNMKCSFRGMAVSIHFDSYLQYHVARIHGKTTYNVTLGYDTSGNMLRLENALDALPKSLEQYNGNLESEQQHFINAKQEFGSPFAQEDDFQAKMLRLKELEDSLNADKEDSFDKDSEQQRRIQNILKKDSDDFMGKFEKMYRNIACKLLNKNQKAWLGKYDKEFAEQMLNKGCSKETAADIIFKFSPNVQDKTVIQNMIDKIKNVQYVH
nr:SNF2-related protein [Pectinatus frisingensis]